MVDAQAIGLAGAFVGTFLNTILHYMRARDQASQTDPNTPLEFDKKFLVTAVMAVGSAGATAILVFPQLVEQITPNATSIMAFMTGAGLGYAFNNGFNMVVSAGASTIRASKEVIAEIRHEILGKNLAKLKESKKE